MIWGYFKIQSLVYFNKNTYSIKCYYLFPNIREHVMMVIIMDQIVMNQNYFIMIYFAKNVPNM